MVLTLPPLMAVVPLASVVTLVKASSSSDRVAKRGRPFPYSRLGANGPSTVWASLIALLPVSVRIVLAPKVIASLYVVLPPGSLDAPAVDGPVVPLASSSHTGPGAVVPPTTPAKRRHPSRIHGQQRAEADPIHRLSQGDRAAAGIGEDRVIPQRDRVVIRLAARGLHAPAIDGGGPVGIGGDTGELPRGSPHRALRQTWWFLPYSRSVQTGHSPYWANDDSRLLPFASVRRVLFPSVTVSLYVWLPVVFTLPPLIAVVPAKSVVTLVRAASFPLPRAAKRGGSSRIHDDSRLNGPSTVWAKVIVPRCRCR